ncbi:hypothetical protein [Mesorhizobium sp.]|uniref:hypothetical protein n=1 Tax=Mesorhizobium sp. TaxID=1871066 RepID=UPI00257E43C9|nr:hypothetical protein [Mesorhizobium sp.]
MIPAAILSMSARLPTILATTAFSMLPSQVERCLTNSVRRRLSPMNWSGPAPVKKML